MAENKIVFEGDNPNPFANRSGPRGDIHNGNKGKFSASQVEERVRLHAMSIATGYPRLTDLPGIFKEKYNIDISLPSEKTWRKSNMDLILKKQQEMIDKGEIEVTTIGPKAISENLQALVVSNIKTLKKMAKKLDECLDKVNDDTHAEIEGMKIKKAKNEALERLQVISEAHSKLNGAVTKQLDTLVNVSGVARGLGKEKEEEDYKDEVNKPASKHFDPSNAEISDEDRALLEQS